MAAATTLTTPDLLQTPDLQQVLRHNEELLRDNAFFKEKIRCIEEIMGKNIAEKDREITHLRLENANLRLNNESLTNQMQQAARTEAISVERLPTQSAMPQDSKQDAKLQEELTRLRVEQEQRNKQLEQRNAQVDEQRDQIQSLQRSNTSLNERVVSLQLKCDGLERDVNVANRTIREVEEKRQAAHLRDEGILEFSILNVNILSTTVDRIIQWSRAHLYQCVASTGAIACFGPKVWSLASSHPAAAVLVLGGAGVIYIVKG